VGKTILHRKLLGDTDYSLFEVGIKLKKHKEFGALRSVQADSDLCSPLSEVT
jgi:hypothetical protein